MGDMTYEEFKKKCLKDHKALTEDDKKNVYRTLPKEYQKKIDAGEPFFRVFYEFCTEYYKI